jgi:predicted transposase/invertase (TIGR01784 family)
MTKSHSTYGAGRYAFLLFDATFKVVICTPENEKLLIEILELLIPGKHIASITFINKELHGLVISEKNVNFDLLCKDRDTGEEFLVEVQNREQKSFRDRMLVYATYPIREQMEVRVQQIRDGVADPMDYSLKPVYVVSMVNFPFTHESEEAIEHDYISRYEIRNQRNGELMTPSLNFVYLELDRLKLKPTEPEKCRSLLERFVFSMKYMHTLKAIPEVFEDDLLKRLFTATELASMTVTTRQNYDKIMHNELDRLAENAFAREKGFAEGEAKGRAEGEVKRSVTIAKAMLADRMDPALIAKYTGLSEEKVRSLM